MGAALHKKSIIKKTAEVGGSTLLSRLFGIIREVLMARYLGAGVISDAFLTAFKIPNSLRKIFAEGALSAAYIPTFVHMIKRNDKKEIDGVMTLSFVIIQGLLALLCIGMVWHADFVIRIIAPGWYDVSDATFSWAGVRLPAAWGGFGTPLEQVAYTIPFLRILMCIILFISSSWLLASALQAVNHFFIPAISPVILNIVLVLALWGGILFNIPVSSPYLSYMIVVGVVIQFMLHVAAYFHYHFSFGPITLQSWHYFKQVLIKFLPVMLSMSVMEVGTFIDMSFASYLPKGSVSLIHYANRFMGIPFGVFATAFATILLPHFSHVTSYAPKRLSFYMLETAKFVLWVTLPVAILMSFFAQDIFITMFLSDKFTYTQVVEAAYILMAFLSGLFFASFNKILLNVYYALHNTRVPALISISAIVLNIVLNGLFIGPMQAVGLAFASALSWMVQTILFLMCLYYLFDFNIYLLPFASFILRYLMQLGVIGTICYLLYAFIQALIFAYAGIWTDMLRYSILYWVWVGPLCLLLFVLLWYTRRMFGLRIYFLE